MLRKPPKTPSEKANRATLRIVVRLLACAYLIYVLYQLLKNSNSADAGMPMPVVIIISAVMIILSVILIVLTVMDFIKGLKNHDYSMHKYYQEELDERGLEYNEDGELVPKSSASDSETEGTQPDDESGSGDDDASEERDPEDEE